MGWKNLSYGDLNRAFDNGIRYQQLFADINTDQADMSAFKAAGGKMILYHGLADFLIPSQGSLHYYENVLQTMGGTKNVLPFFRMYLVPGMGHMFGNGTASKEAAPPIPDHDRLYQMLVTWVESGKAPELEVISNKAKGEAHRSWPLCVYPKSARYTSGDPAEAESYTCN